MYLWLLGLPLTHARATAIFRLSQASWALRRLCLQARLQRLQRCRRRQQAPCHCRLRRSAGAYLCLRGLQLPSKLSTIRRYGGGLSLRELVESFAEQNDVAFMPKPGRTHAGMQVYSFGGVSVVIDAAREEMLAQRLDGDRGWVPASIEQLLEMHAARKGQRGGK